MPGASTQQILEIERIREGMIVLKNKSLRGVLMVSSLNFALKSEEEQNAIIYQFQNFLNSLDFTVEIVLQSRRLNITGYLDKLKEMEEKQENELFKMQIAGYQNFIRDLIAGNAIMSKSFFVVIPFTFFELPGMKKKKGSFQKEEAGTLTEDQFRRAQSQLWQRMEFVSLGLRRCGLQCIPLNTSELVELFWSLYHPGEAEVGYYPEFPPELTI